MNNYERTDGDLKDAIEYSTFNVIMHQNDMKPCVASRNVFIAHGLEMHCTVLSDI